MSIFGEFKINGNELVATETGAVIPLTSGFARDAWRIASFVWLINGLRATRIVRGREPRARISFFPKKPRSYYAIWPVCQLADVKIVDDPDEADLHFYFEDREFLTAPRVAPSEKPAFNVGCFDIRKSVVSRIFEETFGYALCVDPRTHQGDLVEKSESNGKHDGRLVSGPIGAPKPGYVYQRNIENTFDGVEHVDIRTPVVGGKTTPYVFLKRRSRDLRFTNDNHRVDLAATDAMLSREEQDKISAFARSMQLDFGGLDVLRDRTDGRIYIVDANKTDMGPPSAMRAQDKLTAMRGLADSFAAMVDDALKQ
ncbi:hypothetical protein PUV54_09605 [Hyphococcus flavus]|uniref:ATP-grasp domain-containing protein n=1 Tax=Hyphococcus flavus TaxID=1866326 RepID=A0AAE9ZBK8_9PROT|nr:hypothetical protein [Hyphococcus flavus]WDI30215.1 hypothetical protein PUV54_09605 [Hyphococcus flavus]